MPRCAPCCCRKPRAASRAALRRPAAPALRLAADARALLQSATLCRPVRAAGPRRARGRHDRPARARVRVRARAGDRPRAGGGALASWVEGEFLNTDAGFGALSLERVEAASARPRRSGAGRVRNARRSARAQALVARRTRGIPDSAPNVATRGVRMIPQPGFPSAFACYPRRVYRKRAAGAPRRVSAHNR